MSCAITRVLGGVKPLAQACALALRSASRRRERSVKVSEMRPPGGKRNERPRWFR